MTNPQPTPPALRHTMFVHCDVDPPQVIGFGKNGFRQVVPVAGGWFEGDRLKGRIVRGGADWNVLRSDNVTEVHARYTLETDDGALIYIINEGLTTALPEMIGQLLSGQQPDVTDWYFRTTPHFETAAPKYQWLQRALFIGDLLPPSGLAARFHVYEVL